MRKLKKSNLKSSAQQSASSAGESQCNENAYCYKDKNGNEVCLDMTTDEGKKKAKEHAHENRNQFQQGVCPTNLSQITTETGDASTGIIWTPAGILDKYFQRLLGYHKAEWNEKNKYREVFRELETEIKKYGYEVCYRGTIPPEEIEKLKKKCEFRQSAKALGTNPDALNPGFQCCYYPKGHPQAGQLSMSSSFDFESPTGSVEQHRKLDVIPHNEMGGNYEPGKGMSSDKDIKPMTKKELKEQRKENLKYKIQKQHIEQGGVGPAPHPVPIPD